MDFNQEVPIVTAEPAQRLDDVATEPTTNGQYSNNVNGATIICFINCLPPIPDMSLITPLSPPSSSSTMSTTYLSPSSLPPKSSHVPLTPPLTPQAQVDLPCIASKRNLKRMGTKINDDTSPRPSKRIYKYEIILDENNINNFTEKEIKSVKKSKDCKLRREKMAAFKTQRESENLRLIRENAGLLAENRRLKEQCLSLKSKDHLISELDAKIATLKNQIATQTNSISLESNNLADIPREDLTEFLMQNTDLF